MNPEGVFVSLQEIADALKGTESLVICGHVSPDGDCLGSVLGLAHVLRGLDKKVTCLLARDEFIEFGLRGLPGIDDMVPAADYIGQVDTFVALDVPHADRMGQDAKYLHANARQTITVDHHHSEGPMSQLNYTDADSPATAMIVWELARLMGAQRDAVLATCCYTGLMTDCGRFAFQNATAGAFCAAAEMVDAGAQPAEIANQVYYNRSKASLSLEKRLLDRIEYLQSGQIVLTYIMRSDFVETNAVRADAEPLLDLIRSIRGVRVVCMLRELDGQVRGNLRAKDDTDVSALASKLGGGGHRAAAGFTVRGSMKDALVQVRSELNELL